MRITVTSLVAISISLSCSLGITDTVVTPRAEPPTRICDDDTCPIGPITISIPCPAGMRRVQGEYCPSVEQECLRWVDAKGDDAPAPAPGGSGRCGTFKYPTKCLSSQRVHKDFCMDMAEYPGVEGTLPQDWMTWHDVNKMCEARGARMCTKSEWTFACEGEDMQPYPYGDGYHRDRTACNFDNPITVDVFKASKETLRSFLVPSMSNPKCTSPFGIHDLVGNVDEWVVNESGKPYSSGLVGGHVFGVRNACRPMTTAHGPTFSWYETGGRCCAPLDK